MNQRDPNLFVNSGGEALRLTPAGAERLPDLVNPVDALGIKPKVVRKKRIAAYTAGLVTGIGLGVSACIIGTELGQFASDNSSSVTPPQPSPSPQSSEHATVQAEPETQPTPSVPPLKSLKPTESLSPSVG